MKKNLILPDLSRITKKLLDVLLILLIAGIGSCNLAPVFQKPDQDIYDNFKYKAFADSLSSISIDTVWWKYFEDTTLDNIIRQVSLNNNNLQAALYSFEQANILTRVERSPLLPEVQTEINTSRTVVSENAVQSFQSNKFTNYSLLGLASYQLDLWGALRNNYQASIIASEISLLEYYNLLSVLRAQAASQYISIRQLDTQIALYDSTIRLRERSLQIANLNYEAGASDALDPARAETQLRTAQSQRWTLINQRARLENSLAVLTGREPSNFSLPDTPLDSLPPIIPSKIPSEVLTRRPDVWIALKSMEAENARIGIAKANLYPNVTLSAQVGFQGKSFENILTPQSFAWTIGGGLLQPVFNYGRNKALVEAAYARYQEVAELYQQSVLSAFEEVENELANIYYLNNQYRRQQQTVSAATRTLDLARQRYEAGLVSYLEVVDAERTALLNQVDAVGLVGELYQSMINLSLASGGNWESGPQLYEAEEFME
ncbi:efflux transporter outer membrane subunit [Catalinimonas sp. 4WD22]|uniref:efflux transporter outer membrane subunit n=1 Tax=Catalinimonas locisalis TaxID=3133978 RepID=UPI003100C027